MRLTPLRCIALAAVACLAACSPTTADATPTLPPATATQHAINQAHLTDARSDGTYLIGVHMARGVWQTSGLDDENAECYWLTRHADGIILQTYFGPPIAQQIGFSEYDYELSTTGCGEWRYIGTPTPTVAP